MENLLRVAVPLCVVALLVGGRAAAEGDTDEQIDRAVEKVERGIQEAERAAQKGLSAAEARLRAAVRVAREARSAAPGRGVSTQTLVVRSQKTEETELAQVVEDMQIMARIFDKALWEEFGQAYSGAAGGDEVSIWSRIAEAPSSYSRFPYSSAFDRHVVQGLYLEGYGVLFLLPKVDFPLTPPPKVEKPEAEPEADSLWERTKREMYGPRHVALRPEAPKTEYDADKVEKLQKTLLEVLKHSANMSSLQPEESIAVVAQGGAKPFPSDVDPLTSASRVTYRTDFAITVEGLKEPLVLSRGSSGPPTVLTIHVTKSDVDAFAEGELSFDQFRDRATIVVY